MPLPFLAAIKIPFNPNIIDSGGFTLSWHGFLSFIGVAVAVWIVVRQARREQIITDQVYNVAIWGIIGGIIGARVTHVLDNTDIYFGGGGNPFAIWEGGIGLWGAILGGWIFGGGYAWIAGYNVGKFMDLTAPALLTAQIIGRIGDIVNGEHWARTLDAPFAWYFSNPESPGRSGPPGSTDWDPDAGTHPAVVYEMIWDAIVLYTLWRLRGKLTPNGSLWMVYIALYAAGRFAIQFSRLDDEKFWNLQQAHLIAIIVWIVAIPFLVWKTRFRKSGDESGPDTPSGPRIGRGRERRRRARAGNQG